MQVKLQHLENWLIILKKQNKKPLLVACDVYRPAAIKQLEVVGERVGVPVFSMGDKKNPVDIAKAAMEYGRKIVMIVL